MGQGTPISEASDVINEDIPCASCAYNLRGLQESGRCPECGGGIAGSIQEYRSGLDRYGSPLRDVPARRLAMIGAGFLVYLAAAFGMSYGYVFREHDSLGRMPPLWAWCFAAVQLLMMPGLWMLTLQAGIERRLYRAIRIAARATLLVAVAVAIIAVGMFNVTGADSDGPRWTMLLITALSTIVGFAYLVALAGRLRQRPLQVISVILAVGGAAMTIRISSLTFNLRLGAWLGYIPWPTQPLLGHGGEIAWYVRSWRFYLREEFVKETIDQVYMLGAYIVLIWFGFAFIRLAVKNARKTLPNSPP